jgi:3',5'-cyclic-AMP phosphodiesterase
LHHPPFGTGVPAFDDINLKPSDARAFAEVLHGRSNVRHLFFGHIHRTIFGSWHGLPFSTLPATAHRSLLDFPAPEDFYTHESPAYGVVLLDTEQVTIHTENYLYRGPIYHPDGHCVRY